MKGPVFVPSAFRHGYAEEDFYALLAGRYLKVRSQRGLDDIYELLGRSAAGDYLHVVYRTLPHGALRVFHMSRMTPRQQRRFQRFWR
ncbi:MAG: hypothetical protein HY744_24845 [Deltaproteobacteria bacterium]|nr:hypothetical protein [Deltaproteobacteria bacterium]